MSNNIENIIEIHNNNFDFLINSIENKDMEIKIQQRTINLLEEKISVLEDLLERKTIRLEELTSKK